jgi:hypothetical protein
MRLTPEQIQVIGEILNNRVSFFVAENMGADYLSQDELSSLEEIGFSTKEMYGLHKDQLFLQYQLGMMSEVLGKFKTNQITFTQLVDDVRRGRYVPLSPREEFSLQSIKRQALGDIKAYKGKVFNDLNNIITYSEKNNRKAYEREIRKEVEKGIADRASYKEVAQNLGHKTGDWLRNWDRIVQYTSHLAFDEGRAAIFERIGGEDQIVYKDVYAGACQHCIRLYLTEGIGSEPKLFKLSELKDNGSNIGLKVADLKPVIGPTHPHCRCTLHKKENQEAWDKEKAKFAFPEGATYVSSLDRPKVKVTVGEKEFLV